MHPYSRCTFAFNLKTLGGWLVKNEAKRGFSAIGQQIWKCALEEQLPMNTTPAQQGFFRDPKPTKHITVICPVSCELRYRKEPSALPWVQRHLLTAGKRGLPPPHHTTDPGGCWPNLRLHLRAFGPCPLQPPSLLWERESPSSLLQVLF